MAPYQMRFDNPHEKYQTRSKHRSSTAREGSGMYEFLTACKGSRSLNALRYSLSELPFAAAGGHSAHRRRKLHSDLFICR